MKRWRHLLCGVVSAFPKEIDPNEQGRPCPACGIPLGGWVEL